MSHALAFPLAKLKTQKNQNKNHKKPTTKPKQTQQKTLFQQFAYLKASHNKVVVTCIIKHISICFNTVKPAKSDLVYSVFMLLLLYFFTLSVCIYKGRF